MVPWRGLVVGGVLLYDAKLVTDATTQSRHQETQIATWVQIVAAQHGFTLFPYWFIVYTYQTRSQNCENRLLTSSRVFVPLSALKNWAPTWRIFMKCDIWVFFEKSPENSSFIKIGQE